MVNVARRTRLRPIAGIALLAAMAIGAIWAIRGLLAPSLSSELDIPAYAPAAFAVPQGADWQPGERDAQGFAVAARTSRLELRVHPDTGQVVVADL